MKAQTQIKTDFGPLYIVASEAGLVGVFWKEQSIEMLTAGSNQTRLVSILNVASQQLEEYFEGRRKTFDLELSPSGTEFQKAVWTELSKIKYGETISYRELARRIKNPKAIRAVGSANGKNPLSVIVPCHRVIASDGTLGGYSGGLKIKEALLGLEKGS